MSDTPYSVTVLHRSPRATIARVHVAPGHVTERHVHEHDYIVHPRRDATCIRTTYENDVAVKTETIQQKTDEPYAVARTVPGQTFTITNSGDTPMLFEKIHLTS